MNQESDYVRSDTPDPRVGVYNMEDRPVCLPHMDISSAWPYMGTNSSALRGSEMNRNMSTDITWSPNIVGVRESSM